MKCRKWARRVLGVVFAVNLGGAASLPASRARAEAPQLPHVSQALPQSARSYAFSAADHQVDPIDLSTYGYVEREYTVSGPARVFDWPSSPGGPPQVRSTGGHYTTRILVRMPVNPRRFNGTVIVEPLNPSESVDLPIMWAESYAEMMRDGYAWVGVTIKPNDIASLKRFDPARYASLEMPNPRPGPACAAAQINPLSLPTTQADETGLAWDMLSEIGALLKSASPSNPIGRAAERLYMTGQSQTAGYARTYASLFAHTVRAPDGSALYDGYLYSGSPPWQVPLHQCRRDLDAGDPRLITPPVGVPVIEIFTQGDMKTNVPTRRPDADTPADLFRRYEVAGAAHVDNWEERSFASASDRARAGGRPDGDYKQLCTPHGLPMSDFPTRYVFDAAWRNLDAWVRQGVSAPHAARLELKASVQPLPPDQAFVTDSNGNARGGLRTPYVNVPTARWVGARSGPFMCLFYGYRLDFSSSKLKQLYGDHEGYVREVKASARELAAQRWLTSDDVRDIDAVAERAAIPQ